MKTVLVLSILFSTITLPALGELTDADINKIRLIVNEAVEPLKTDIVTLKTDVAWIRGKFEGIDKQFESVDKQFESVNQRITHATNVSYGLIALIVAAIAIPQILMAWRSRADRSLEKQIETLTQEIETLKQQRIISP